jgi:hypothetical protein
MSVGKQPKANSRRKKDMVRFNRRLLQFRACNGNGQARIKGAGHIFSGESFEYCLPPEAKILTI